MKPWKCIKCENEVTLNDNVYYKPELCTGCNFDIVCKGPLFGKSCLKNICECNTCKHMFSIYNVKRGNNKDTVKYLWYSVRPTEGLYNDHKFHKRILKFLKCKYIEDYIFCLEWKWDGDHPSGVHAHILIKPVENSIKYVNTHINRQSEKFFNLNAKQRYYIYQSNIHLVNDKLDYMSGLTWDGGKNEEKVKDNLRMIKLFGQSHLTGNETLETWRDIVKKEDLSSSDSPKKAPENDE